jgi:hypothetical protein
MRKLQVKPEQREIMHIQAAKTHSSNDSADRSIVPAYRGASRTRDVMTSFPSFWSSCSSYVVADLVLYHSTSLGA